jgi:cytochrome b pre-mRNA-processing protein 3
MLSRFFKTSERSSIPREIYGAVMAQSRDRAFYTVFGLPDTVTGRLEMLCLHLFLVGHAFARSSNAAAAMLSQEIFDLFVDDLDRALRELGIGDAAVPKRKRRMIRAYYGQIEAYARPLEDNDPAELAKRLDERLYGGSNPVAAADLAAYMLDARRLLEQSGRIDRAADPGFAGIAWPEPMRRTGGKNWPGPEE